MKRTKLYIYWVKRFLWHRNQGYNELTEPMNGLGTLLNLFNFLLLRYDFKPSTLFYIELIIAANIILGITGLILKRIGIISLGQTLNNEQNPMLSEILVRVKNLEEKK